MCAKHPMSSENDGWLTLRLMLGGNKSRLRVREAATLPFDVCYSLYNVHAKTHTYTHTHLSPFLPLSVPLPLPLLQNISQYINILPCSLCDLHHLFVSLTLPRWVTDRKTDKPVSMLFPTEKDSRLVSRFPRIGGMGPGDTQNNQFRGRTNTLAMVSHKLSSILS